MQFPGFIKKTTATVMAGFQKTLDELREVERTHADEAEQHRVSAEQSIAAHHAAAGEATAARTAAQRIATLFGEGIGIADKRPDGIGGAITGEGAGLAEGIGGA